MDEGRIVEDGEPAALAKAPHSLDAQLLAAERAVHTDLWARRALPSLAPARTASITEESEKGSEQPWTAERQVSRGR